MRFTSNDFCPVLPSDKLLQLLRALAGRIQPSDKAAHAGTGYVVDRNVVLLKPSQDADMGKSQGSAAFEDHTDTRARFSGLTIGGYGNVRRWLRSGIVLSKRDSGKG